MRLEGQAAYRSLIKPPNPYYAQNAQAKKIFNLFFSLRLDLPLFNDIDETGEHILSQKTAKAHR